MICYNPNVILTIVWPVHLTKFTASFINLMSHPLLNGCFLFQGSIYTVKVNPYQSTLSRTHRTKTSSKHKFEFTTIEYRTFSLMIQGPVLLSLTQDGNFVKVLTSKSPDC